VFCAPATAQNRSLVRISINAALSDQELERLVDACDEIRDEVDMWNWPSTRRQMQRSAGRSRAPLQPAPALAMAAVAA
jgi:CAI-1 autoinducer synthase